MSNTPDFITITGAREHNLKNLSLQIPKNKLVVFTGLSGSGKSSLAFDTLYAEGQRRYVESLSSYARQFLGVMRKPDIDHIDGLSPAISIDQKTTSHNPRSTVGTITEIYDYLRLLFARAGVQYCPDCQIPVTAQSIDEIVTKLEYHVQERLLDAVRFLILAPVVKERKGEFHTLFINLIKQGYTKARIDGAIYNLEDDITLIKTNKHTIEAVVDRMSISPTEWKRESHRKEWRSRLVHSIEAALKLADGTVTIAFVKDSGLSFPENPTELEDTHFSEKKACQQCGNSYADLEPRLFSFNSPEGACPECNGLGSILTIDHEKIIAPDLTLSEGAIIPFSRVLTADTWWARLVRTVADDEGIDFRKTIWSQMPEKSQEIFLYGSTKKYRVEGENRFGDPTVIHEIFEGFIPNLERRYRETESSFIQQEISQFMHRKTCDLCLGKRLNQTALAVRIGEESIADVTDMPIEKAKEWTNNLASHATLTNQQITIAEPIRLEISARLEFLISVGLDYLSLSREAGTLAGGEAQRIRLASQIGTGLSGVLYILDEPTIGLHQRDNHRLIETLRQLQQKGNSVIVVEHDRDIMLAADQVFDFGPGAGEHGGNVVASGTPAEIMQNKKSLTGNYLSRKKEVRITHSSAITSTTRDWISIEGATHHNLKNVETRFPLQSLTCITGVSGSGKSTLLHDTLYAHLAKKLGYKLDFTPGELNRFYVPDRVKRVSLIDQSPIGKTPRSNPATYTKVFDYIRQVFAMTKDAKLHGYNAGRFSFNVKGGRCESCQGDGQIKIEMQFLPDIYVTCEVCNGKRYNQETLEVQYRGKNIADVLALSVDEAIAFFSHHSSIKNKLETLHAVGLGYLRLGQSAPTLSGGEAQRVKLAKELATKSHDHIVYLLDEPTTGLHFGDVQKLLDVLLALVANDNTIIVIEHNLDVIKNAQWIIDLGPEGGERGGQIVAEGTPTDLAQSGSTHTTHFLKDELALLKNGYHYAVDK